MTPSAFLRHSWLVVSFVTGMLVACNSATAPDKSSGPVSGNVTIDGSATVLPLSKAIAAAFRKSNPTVQFAIALSGTGGGFKKFCAGGIDIEDASRPIRSDESEECKAQHIEYIELPVAFDSLSVVVNAKNTFVDCLTVKELKAIWEPAAEGQHDPVESDPRELSSTTVTVIRSGESIRDV